MKSVNQWIFLFFASVSVAACGNSEKAAAEHAAPVMSATDMVAKFCSGDMDAVKPLTEACKQEQDKFGRDFKDGTNCKELQSAYKKMDELRKAKPGACRPSLRF